MWAHLRCDKLKGNWTNKTVWHLFIASRKKMFRKTLKRPLVWFVKAAKNLRGVMAFWLVKDGGR